jgi:predicted Fe-Mo cluster-binding NifX family protein
MKIAVATEDNESSSTISTQGARALFFLVFDADGDLSEILENPYADNSAHVGPDVANMLIRLKVTTVVAGRFGPRFKQALQENRIECIEQTGFASQVVKELVKSGSSD